MKQYMENYSHNAQKLLHQRLNKAVPPFLYHLLHLYVSGNLSIGIIFLSKILQALVVARTTLKYEREKKKKGSKHLAEN